MTKRQYVLDASTLLCLLFDEPGADKVEAVLHGAMIGVANYAEVIGKLIDKGHSAEAAIADLAELDLDIVALDRKQSEIAGALRVATRQAGLSLGDRACLALARATNRTALTADRAWAGIAEQAGIAVALVR